MSQQYHDSIVCNNLHTWQNRSIAGHRGNFKILGGMKRFSGRIASTVGAIDLIYLAVAHVELMVFIKTGSRMTRGEALIDF